MPEGQDGRLTEVPEEMERLKAAIGDIEATFSALVERIRPVMRADEGPSADDTEAEQERSAPLASELQSCVRSLNTMTKEIQQVCNRVEV